MPLHDYLSRQPPAHALPGSGHGGDAAQRMDWRQPRALTRLSIAPASSTCSAWQRARGGCGAMDVLEATPCPYTIIYRASLQHMLCLAAGTGGMRRNGWTGGNPVPLHDYLSRQPPAHALPGSGHGGMRRNGWTGGNPVPLHDYLSRQPPAYALPGGGHGEVRRNGWAGGNPVPLHDYLSRQPPAHALPGSGHGGNAAQWMDWRQPRALTRLSIAPASSTCSAWQRARGECGATDGLEATPCPTCSTLPYKYPTQPLDNLRNNVLML